MKLITTLVALAALGYGGFWVCSSHPEYLAFVQELFHFGSFHTLEVRYSANQVMEAHRSELLKDSRYKYLEPQIKFVPFVLMDVKYSVSSDKTRETVILWDLSDGEMVIDGRDWEKTHGLGECMHAGVDRNDFKVLHQLAKRGGSTDRDNLLRSLHIENEVLDSWLESCRRKKLVVQSGNRIRLHLEEPRIKVTPETRLEQPLVTVPYRGARCLSARFSVREIEQLCRSAFGHDFAIKKTTQVFLPIHSIVVQNPDGSLHTTHWNALTGSRLSDTTFLD